MSFPPDPRSLGSRPPSLDAADRTTTDSIEMTPLMVPPDGYGNESLSQTTFSSITLQAERTGRFTGSPEPSQRSSSLLEPPGVAIAYEPLDKPSTLRRYFLDTWICETAALVFSIACMVVIVIMLSLYKNKAVAQLPAIITLNTMIAVLSTAARSALVYAVSALIGQLKWCWLRRSNRRLQDVQAIDDASRGPLGAIGVLSTWIGGPLTALGSAITLLLIAFGPFVQQLVEYPTHEIPQAQTDEGTGAIVLQNLNYTLFQGSSDGSLDKLGSVVAAGLNFNPDFLRLRATCPTARCSWDNFKSIGWCSKCQDATDSAVVEDCDVDEKIRSDDRQPFCRVTLPYETPSTLFINSSTYAILDYVSENRSDYTIKYTTEAIWRIGAVNIFTTDFEPFETLGIPDPIVVLGYAALEMFEDNKSLSGHPSLRLGAAGYCALTLCEREYEAQVVNSVSEIHERGIKYGRLFKHNTTRSDSNINTLPEQHPTCWQPEDEKVDLISPDEGFTWLDLNRRAFCPVQGYARELIPHLLLNSSREHVMNWDRQDRIPEPPFEDSRARLDRVAAALTSYGLSVSNTTHLGTVMLSETYLNVRWWWIIYPGVLQLASAVLLLSTIWYSHRIGAPLWKSSLLAIYYHQIEDLGFKGDTSVERLSGMDKAARGTKLRFL